MANFWDQDPVAKETKSPWDQDEVFTTPGGYGPGTVAKDVGKLVGAGAVKGIAGAPETVQAVASETGRNTLFAPSAALNLIADPRRLANKLVGAVGLPPVFEVTKEQPLVPAQVTEKQKLAVNETLAKGKVPQLRQLTEYGNKLSEDIESTISPEMRLAMAESQPTGNIVKALETGDFSELSMGTNPTALGLTGQAVKVFGSSAPALLVAMVTKSAGPATAVGFGQAGAEGIDEARNYVKSMSDEELNKKSEYFRNLVTLGYSPKDARLMTEDKAADTAALYQGSVGALGSAFTTKLIQGGFDKALLGNVKSRLGKIVQGTAIAGAEGALTEAAEGVATDLGIDKTIVREIGVDSFANLVLGAIGEAAPGVIRGAVAPGEPVKGAEAPESKAVPVPEGFEADPVVGETPVAVPPAIITEEEFEADEGLTPVSPTPPPAAPSAVTPAAAPAAATPAAPAAPVAATAEIAQRIEELDAELKQIDAAYATATPDQFGELNARQGEIKSEISRLFQAGTTGAPVAPVEAVTPVTPAEPVKPAVPSREEIKNSPIFAGIPQQLIDLQNKMDEADVKADNYNVGPIKRNATMAFRRYSDATKEYLKPYLTGDKDADQTLWMRFTDLLSEKAREIKETPAVEAPEPAEVAMSKNKRLTNFLSQDKNELIERIAKNNNISPEYAEKAYNAEKEYLENFARYGYGPNPDPDHENKFIAAQKKYDAFQNRLRSVREKSKKTVEPVEVKKTQAEINRERQAEKKAKATKPAKLSDTLSGKDLVDMFVPEQYKKPAQEYVDANIAYAKAWEDMEKIKDKNERQQFANNVTGARGQELDAIGRKLPQELVLLLSRGMATESLNQQQEIISAYEETTAPKKPTKKAEAKKKPAKEEHIEGKKSEPVTSKTIEEAIDKAEVTVDSSKIKTAIKNQFEQAIKRAKIKTEKEWESAKGLLPAEKFVTISVPGDGQFKVKNNVERLKELQTKMVNATTLKGPTVKGAPSSGAIEAFKGMVDDKDMENAIEYAKLKGLDPKTIKLTPAQRTTVDSYLKNPAEFERQQEDQTEYYRKQAIASREANDKLIRERNEAYEKRDEEARFDAVLKTTIRSTQPQLKSDIAKRKITSMDAARMLEVIPSLPTGTVKPYVIKELEKVAGVKPTEEKDNIKGFTANLPAIRQTKVKNDLLADINYKGKITSRADLIQRLVNEGRTITEIKNKKPITKAQEQEKNQLSKKYIVGASNENLPGVKRLKELQDIAKNGNVTVERVLGTEELHLAQDQITKTGMDYAQYLINKKTIQQSDKAGKPADKPYYNDFTSNIDYNELYKRAEVSREDRIKEYAQTRAASRRALKKIAKYGSDIPMQRELNDLLNKEEMLKAAVSINKPKRNTAADFIARATQEMANENMAPEVEAVIRQVYEKYPSILEGLRLSLRTRQAGGNEAGNFNPYNRIVTLWKDSSGVDNPSTIRHELTHSLEQMMTPEARQAVVEAWARSFETAIKRNTDKKSQEFFNKVFDFLDNPSKQSFDAATNVMPSYDFYQYMNPSEYWAVNAEKLMAAKLGTPWARFVSAVKKILEALKSVFGVNNTFTVHKEFDNIINGKFERTKGEEMLVDYLLQGKVKIDFLNSIEDVNDLLDKHSRPDAPRKPSPSVRDTFMGGYENTKETVKDVLVSPVIATNNMIGKADRALTYFRNKNIFFGYGLEEADRQRYGGQVRNAHQQAIASVAVVNALHSGHVATQVMTLGKLEFDPNIQMFVAAKSDKSMANVVREKAKLIDKLGFETGNRVIQAYFEAKRSKSIVNEYLNREAAYETAIEAGQNEEEARKDLANIEAAVKKVNMDDEAIDDFIALEDKYPELKNMMSNWTSVNQNMIDMMEFSGIISKQRAKSLRSIEDYVPWYRIMDDQEDIHFAPKGTRGLTNVAAEKKFGPGETDRDIDDIVDNMIHNVLTITRNSARNYAANRIVMEYGERYKEGKNAGKLRVFPKDGSDADGVRFNIIANGRRIVVRIQDPLVAEAVIGMENIDIPMNGALAFMANTLRRSITTFPAFQVAQLFMDAPTAALVTGLKNPAAVWSGVFTSFLKNLRKDDPIVARLRAAGIGGYQSSARTPEKEIQLDIGLIQGSWFSKAMKGLDRFGDASDYAQRRSVYLQTMKETGDEMLALFQANNVIDFKKRGSGQIAQLVTKQVAFMNAYAQSIDVLAKGLSGTGLKGIDRKKALARMATTGMLLASATIVYCMLVGDDDEYNKLDDQTKIRTIFIPGLDMRLPMHSGAAFFFKAIPELIYNKITKEGTKDEYDQKRLTRALSKAAADSLLGPNITPTGVKPVVEILLNRNFFTGGQVTPRGMEDLAAYRQYNQNTSELGKIISSLTGTEKSRLLNPIEADHLVRGLTGTVGAAVMWGTNLLAGDRVAPQAKDNPFYGQFIMPDVPRGREDLYYDLKSKTDEAYKTFQDLQKKGRREEAADWFKENKKLIQIYGYTSSIEADLKRINGEIRRMSDLPKEKMNPTEKRERMTELQELKGRILKDVISMRKRAGFDE